MTPSNARSLAVTTMQKAGIILLVLVFVGCSQIDAPPVTSAQTQTASDGATGLIAPTSANEQRWRIDPRTSMALIYTYKGGKLARFGHNHVIAAHALTGTVILTETVSGSRFALTIPVSELSVDEAPLRRRASAAFDSEPSPEDIAATRTNMLGERGLHASAFPLVTITGSVISVDGESAQLEVLMQIHGQQRRLQIPARYSRSGRDLRIVGDFTMQQSDFGITPFSVMLGALTVLDEVKLEFDLRAMPNET